MNEDEYVALVDDARESLRRLLVATEPGTGLSLHSAYNDLKAMGRPVRALADRRLEEMRYENGWKRIPTLERERIMLELLGERRLTIAELTQELKAAQRTECAIYDSHVRAMVYRLYRAGGLDRAGEQWHGKTRYRYFRKPLSGPIADLERKFHERSPDEPGTVQ